MPNPVGRRPAAYRIYASDEKGFSVSDETFSVTAGMYDFRHKTSTKSPTQFPANYVTQTTGTELAVVGSGVELEGANKAFYRVVAVDESGNLSGPSDYAAAPRPMIYSEPIVSSTVGGEYQYQLRAIRSLGDSRTRVVNGREVMAYWDVEQLRFETEQGPKWLTIDKVTGRLSGKPDQVGEAEVIVVVTLEREKRTLDPAQLQWGIEKPVDTRLETVGTAKQTFRLKTTR